MKRTIKLSVIILVLAVLLAVFAVTMAACNKDKEQSVSADYSKYAGKYYEVRDGKMNAEIWIELSGDGTWTDDDGVQGTYKVNGNVINLYWPIEEEPVITGYIENDDMTLWMFYENVLYKRSAPPTDTGSEEPEEPQEKTYCITFAVNGGDRSIAPQYYKEGEVLTNLPIPTREGYNFVRWRDSKGDTYGRTFVMPANDLKLTAEWEKKVTVYDDEYVTFKPAKEGKKHSNNWYDDYGGYGIDKYIYVELTSDDLGGMDRVGQAGNFKLSELEFAVNSGYQWTWYSEDFHTINGAQIFTLKYGSNIQFVTAQDSSGNVKVRYLVDIYVLHDYKVDFYKDIFVPLNDTQTKRSYYSCWIVENEIIPEDVERYTGNSNLTPAGFLYMNNTTGKFEDYNLTTPVTHDLSLYQAYENVKINTELDNGTLEGELTVKPYIQFQILPIPIKEGYDFIGWKKDDGTYFADITGNTTLNYLSDDYFFNNLTAEWRAKKYYEVWDGDEVTFVPTVPYATYFDSAQSKLCEVVYVPEGYDCTLPVNTPSDLNFTCWKYYTTSAQREEYNFEQKLTKPIALHAETEWVDYTYNIVPLNSDRSFSSNNGKKYRAYIPFPGTYTLKATGEVRFGVYKDAFKTDNYISTSSSEVSVEITADQAKYVTLTVTSYSGTFTFGLYGATALSNGNYITDGTYISVGEKLIAEEEDFCRWTANGEKVSDEAEYTVQASDSGKTFKKELHVISGWIEDNPASCTKKAHHHKECANCDHIEDDEDYGDLLSHEMGNWVEDTPATCTALAHHHKECVNCGYLMLEEDYGEILPHELSDWIEDNPASCAKRAHHHKDCANCDYREDADYGETLPHTFDPVTRKCKVCQYVEYVYVTGDNLYFGEYPQTKETDNGITATLAQMSGNRPVKGKAGKWTDYGYYVGINTDSEGYNGTPVKDEYMWYIDLTFKDVKYRGVYFISGRPAGTTSNSVSSLEENGYCINTLYWFKWEPIKWRVLENSGEELFLMSDIVLDAQQYYHEYNGTRTIDGKTVYHNNYKESDIRAWLNGTFYNWAFNKADQSAIKTTLVDNSIESGAAERYACENTNDKVFLLSYADVVNPSYGFSPSDLGYDTAKCMMPTDYAQSQGAYVSQYSLPRGLSWWWLRSPNDYVADDNITVVSIFFVYENYGLMCLPAEITFIGVVPAIKIQL